MPLSTLKVPQEGQASPTIKRKFEVVSLEDTKRPLKSIKTKSLKTPLKSDKSRTNPKKLDMPQKSDKLVNIDSTDIKKNASIKSTQQIKTL